MTKFGNSRAISRVKGFVETASSMHIPGIAGRSKFNFSYFIQQDPGLDFGDLVDSQLKDLLEKLKHFSRKSLLELTKEGAATFVVYKDWPPKSDFTWPSHVSKRVHWARFRLGSKLRLVGFVVPDDLNGVEDESGLIYDRNTFYVVFIDPDHKFWIGEKD